MQFDGDFVDKIVLYTTVILLTLLSILHYGCASNKRVKINLVL